MEQSQGVNPVSMYGQTALKRASKPGMTQDASDSDHAMVSMHIQISELDVNEVDKSGQPVLIPACHDGSWNTEELVLHGKDANVNSRLGPTDATGKTELIKACMIAGKFNTVSMITERDDSDLNMTDDKGNSALMVACGESDDGTIQNDKVVEILLKRAHINVNDQNAKGKTALNIACSADYSDETAREIIVALLLCRDDIDVNVVDGEGETGMMGVCHWGNVQVVEMLLKRTEIDVNQQNARGQTALHCVLCQGHIDETVGERLVSLLLEREDTDVNIADVTGNTPLMDACRRRNANIVEMILKRPEIDVNKQNANGQTALHCVVWQTYKDEKNLWTCC